MSEVEKLADTKVDEPVERDYESEAKDMGWASEDKFKGDPKKWVDAKTYVENGERILPLVKHELKKTREELAEIKRSAQQAAQEYQKFADANADKNYKEKYAALLEAKKTAINTGDGETSTRVDEALKMLDQTKPQVRQQIPADPVFDLWKSSNDWYDKDEDMTIEANVIGATLVRQGVRGAELYTKVREQMEKRNPEKFGIDTRTSPQRGNKTTGFQKTGKTYDNLPDDAKKQCDRFIKNGQVKNKDQYVSNYGWDE